MSSVIQLIQSGYKHVSFFNSYERAEARAAFHRKQGHEARVVKQTNSLGTEFYSVYIKLKEA